VTSPASSTSHPTPSRLTRSIYRKLGVSTREQLLERAATLDLSEHDAADVHNG
jgi:hypothetical protein